VVEGARLESVCAGNRTVSSNLILSAIYSYMLVNIISRIRGRVLEIIAFIGGFSLMAYEMVAARLLAPTIGSSTYVWTSVIGVIIAALSIGYFMGGKLADARNKGSDVAWLHIFAASAVLWTLLSYEWVLASVAGGVSDVRVQGVVASLFLFVPASLLLGAISPYLVKLKIKSLKTSGSSAASLSAWNSIGGIVGTFIAGFILFGFIGSKESLVIFIALLLLASWMSMPRSYVTRRLVITTIVISIAAMAGFGHMVDRKDIVIDTPSANYRIFESQSIFGKTRLLTTGPGGAQSGIYLDNPDVLLFWYTREIARVVAAQEHRDNILVLGGGAFTLPRYLAQVYPESRIDTVEIDPDLEGIAREYFNYEDFDNHQVISGDARIYANQTDQKYDIVIMDAYGDISVPFSLMTEEYGDSVNKLLKPNGVAVVNIIAAFEGNCRPLLGAMHAVYANHFDYGYYIKNPDSPPSARGNIIAVYGNNQQNLIDFLSIPPFHDSNLYTDNFMPADRLHQQCLAR
jgi:predicted membrane-bound spermidine synthase